jgi:CheY-like chemotaxis protein
MQQLLETLVENAGEAIADKATADGEIEITVTQTLLTESDLADAQFETNARPGSYVVLEVSDNGSGMEEELIPRIFDPYFSTRFTGRGLGLAAVQGIVRGHDACLFLGTAVGQGTKIRIAFPAADASTEQYRSPKFPHPDKVLIVDDESPVLDVARNYLEEIGINVLTADTANKALELVERHGNSIEVMILDYLMPDKTGLELLDKIAQEIEVDTYLTSGFSRGEISDPDIRCLLTGFIAKPFNREELQGLFKSDQTQ